MHPVIWWLAATDTPTPTPSPSDVDPILVTPGPAGFIVGCVLAVAVFFLVWDMLRRIRRGNYRAQINEELDAAEDAAASGDDDGSPRA